MNIYTQPNIKSSTEVIIGALKVLAGDIKSPDNIPQLALEEAWNRLEELDQTRKEIIDDIISKIVTNKHKDGRKKPKKIEYVRKGDKCYQCKCDISKRNMKALYCMSCSKKRSKMRNRGGYNRAIDEVLEVLRSMK